MHVKGGMIRIVCGCLFGVAMACEALAGVPTDQIRETTDKIIAIVSDPELKDAERASERNHKIRQAVDEYERSCNHIVLLVQSKDPDAGQFTHASRRQETEAQACHVGQRRFSEGDSDSCVSQQQPPFHAL